MLSWKLLFLDPFPHLNPVPCKDYGFEKNITLSALFSKGLRSFGIFYSVEIDKSSNSNSSEEETENEKNNFHDLYIPFFLLEGS